MSAPQEEPRGPRKAYIALGSNMGDRIGWIEKACNEMDARGIRVKRTSSLWETEPMYVLDQDRFVNGACEVETTLEPLELLDALQDIENSLGRKKVIDKGPRNIDLDILLYDNIQFNHERLTIPHIGIPEREFVLRPLAELIPSTSSPSSDHPNLLQTITTLLSSGATMIDIGGQSTAPGTPEVPLAEELARVIPAIQLIRSSPAFASRPVLISVDTYRAAVAEAAVNAGADIVNDVSGGSMDPDMLSTVARLGATICLMHMRGTPATMNSLASYPDSEGGLIGGIARELLARVSAAEEAGVRRWRIVLDPGLGFAKIGPQNVDVLRRLEELRGWPGLEGLPWLVGSSRKSFIGRVTGVPTPRERIWGTAATVAAAVQGGADVVRVHDVREMAQVVAMADAIWRY
ncbi:trifunctional dihydropteroate synthetase [Collariella sp. IMI 366227]|nr:trifunctional dihydropteroate synthetase [Collariella sp. IMI 366227]